MGSVRLFLACCVTVLLSSVSLSQSKKALLNKLNCFTIYALTSNTKKMHPKSRKKGKNKRHKGNMHSNKMMRKKRILCKNPSTSWSFKFQTDRNWNIVTSSISSISICMQWKHSNGFPNERADRDRASAHKPTKIETKKERFKATTK